MAWLPRRGTFISRPPVLITLAVLVGLGYVAWVQLYSYVSMDGHSTVDPPYGVEDLVVQRLRRSHKFFLGLPQPPAGFIISDSTVPKVASATARYALVRRIRDAFPRLSEDAIAVMVTNMARRAAVSLSRTEIPWPQPVTPLVLVSAGGMDSITAAGIAAESPACSDTCNAVILTLSGTGFSPDSTLALVYATGTATLSERHAWYFMYFKVGDVWKEAFYMPGDG